LGDHGPRGIICGEEGMVSKEKKGYIVIDRELCKGCYLCMEFCPRQRIKISGVLNQKGYSPVEFEETDDPKKKCTGCATCATMCPDLAIEVYRE
jgi:2-oxoglutarate ferredoxin oxidoreductase subunit delta